MGRHSSPDQGPFYGSVARWFAPWAGALVVVGVVVWFAAGTFGGDDGKPVVQASPSPTPEETPEASPSPSPTPKASPSPKPSKTGTLITDGVTLQVLNASGDSDADDRIAAKLERLGFEIVTVEDSLSSFTETHVYWAHPGAQAAARALADKLGWIAEAQPAELSLSAEVDLHILVGADEAT
jgi:LytR cell envelope-related transcriptional attenuator